MKPAADADKVAADVKPEERQSAPSTSAGPTATYERSGMSRVESLDAQLKAARMQIEALQKELAESKAAWSLPPHTRAVRRDGTIVEVEPPQVVVVDRVPILSQLPGVGRLFTSRSTAKDESNKVPAPAPNLSIRYSDGKLEAVALPEGKVVWVAEVGPLGTIESVDGGKIVIQNANGRWYAVATNDGRILEEKAGPVSPDVHIGVSRLPVLAKPEAAEFLPREAGNAARTENRLDALEKELTQLTKAVDRLANSDGQRAAQAERALKAAEMAARDAEKAASDAKANYNVNKGRQWEFKAQNDSAKPKDDEKPAPGEQAR